MTDLSYKGVEVLDGTRAARLQFNQNGIIWNLWVRDVATTIRRIQRRVVQGGHNIEPEVSRRRFYKTLQNFFQVYRPVFDSWRLFENDGLAPRLIALEKNGRLAIRDPKQFEKLAAEAGMNL